MSRRAILYLNMSVDGFIADTNGKVSWKGGDSEFYQGDYGKSGFFSVIDTIVVGKNAYDAIVERHGQKWPYTERTIVISHKNIEKQDNVEFVNKSIRDVINDLKAENGENIGVLGGAEIANDGIDHDVFDEYHFVIHPVMLGRGKRLFNGHNRQVNLTLKRSSEKNGVIDCLYERVEF